MPPPLVLLLVPHVQMQIHSVEFSPTFASDQTVFISGWNIGVAVSHDAGLTFDRLWDGGGVIPGGSYVKLALSPRFAIDGVLAATVSLRSVPDNCTLTQTLTGGGGCYGSFDRSQGRGAVVHISTDRGTTWTALDGGIVAQRDGMWQGDVRLVVHPSDPRRLAVIGVENGRLLLNPSLSPGAWCLPTGQGDATFGRNGLAVHSSLSSLETTIILGRLGGGSIVATLDVDGCTLTNTTTDSGEHGAPPFHSGDAAMPAAFTQIGVPGDDHLRGVGMLRLPEIRFAHGCILRAGMCAHRLDRHL
jgi:hypothetical protein